MNLASWIILSIIAVAVALIIYYLRGGKSSASGAPGGAPGTLGGTPEAAGGVPGASDLPGPPEEPRVPGTTGCSGCPSGTAAPTAESLIAI